MALGFVVELLAIWFGVENSVQNQTATLAIGAVIIGLGAFCQILGASGS